MENPFKQIGQPPREVPKDLKRKVMGDIAAFMFFVEVTGLFTRNYSEALASFLRTRGKKKLN